MKSFAKVLHDMDIRLRPDSIVGMRYAFATSWSNKPLVVKGLISQFLWPVADELYYTATGEKQSPIIVFGLIRGKGDWRLQARVQHAVIHLSGKIELIK